MLRAASQPRRWAVIAIAALTMAGAACGKKGPPLAPIVRIPAAVEHPVWAAGAQDKPAHGARGEREEARRGDDQQHRDHHDQHDQHEDDVDDRSEQSPDGP